MVTAWPALARTPASEITQDQVIDMLRRPIEQGKGRTSNKLRAYLRAAFQCAVDVRVTAPIPVAFRACDVQVNPVAQTRRDGRFDSADVRANSITIYDTKGRPGRGARTHAVPIVKAAVRDLLALERIGDYVLSSTRGVKPISGTTLSGWAARVVGDAIGGFQLKRARSGVETLLAADRISREIRGPVQSYGLTGIQARHCDGHDDMLEKPKALDVLVRELIRGPTRSKTAKAQPKAASSVPRALC